MNQPMAALSILLGICIGGLPGNPTLLCREDIPLPSIMKDQIPENATHAVLLYGYVCVGCPIGFYLDSIKQDKDALIIVPAEMPDNDMANLKRAFALQGRIIRGTEAHSAFLQDIAKLKNFEDWKANLILELKNREIIRLSAR